MRKFYTYLFCVALFFAASAGVALASPMLTTPSGGSKMYYKWIDTEHYDVSKIGIKNLYTFEPHQIAYDFEHTFGTGDYLTRIGAAYAYKGEMLWMGGGISSASNIPFSRLNVVDFDVFAAFKVVNRISQYAEAADGSMKPYYMNLYLGVDYSTERILLDGYPMPVIRFEYNIPRFYMIIGYPLTYIKADVGESSYIELQYEPVLNGHIAYNMSFGKMHALEFRFQMENEKYRLAKGPVDVYYFNQTKYYTQMMSIQATYKLTIEKIITIAPYIGFIIDGSTYYGKKFGDFNNRSKTGLGYMLGLNFEIKIL